jgi:hypothetical protein
MSRISAIGERPPGMKIPVPLPMEEPEPVMVRVKVPVPVSNPDPPLLAPPPTTDSSTSAGALVPTVLPGGAATVERVVTAATTAPPVGPAVEQVPWSRPLGIFAENRMLRFLYLDKVIGWVFQIRFDNWYAKTLPTADKDPQPEEFDRHKVSSAAGRHGRVTCATPPADAADNRAVPEVFAPWRHDDLLRRDDKLRKDRKPLL